MPIMHSLGKLEIVPSAKLTLSEHDKADLRLLIIKEYEFAEYVGNKEESITHATDSLKKFLEYRLFELR